MLDLVAPIVPGNSAAGFQLGQRLDDVVSTLSRVVEWHPGLGSLEGMFRSLATDVWVRNDWRSTSGLEDTWLYLGGGAVSLLFRADGILASIRVSDGYRGSVWGDVAIGSKIAAAKAHIELAFDDAEEQFYPLDETQPNVEFYTTDDGDTSMPISTISINTYSPK